MTSISDFARIGNENAPVGSPEWCLAAQFNLRTHKHNYDAESSSLKFGLLEFKNCERWRQLLNREGKRFESWVEFVEYSEPYGLGMSVERVEVLMRLEQKPTYSDIVYWKTDNFLDWAASDPVCAWVNEYGEEDRSLAAIEHRLRIVRQYLTAVTPDRVGCDLNERDMRVAGFIQAMANEVAEIIEAVAEAGGVQVE